MTKRIGIYLVSVSDTETPCLTITSAPETGLKHFAYFEGIKEIEALYELLDELLWEPQD